MKSLSKIINETVAVVKEDSRVPDDFKVRIGNEMVPYKQVKSRAVYTLNKIILLIQQGRLSDDKLGGTEGFVNILNYLTAACAAEKGVDAAADIKLNVIPRRGSKIAPYMIPK